MVAAQVYAHSKGVIAVSKLRNMLLSLLFLVVVIVLVGCGGNSSPSATSSPALTSAMGVSPQAVGTELTDGAAPLQNSLAAGAVSCYWLPAGTSTTPWLVTLQPGADGDADLRLFQLQAPKGTWTTLGTSLRTPSSSAPDALFSGFNPDWVFAPTVAGFRADVAVFAVRSAGSADYTIEADQVRDLVTGVQTPQTDTVGPGGSRWYRFHVATAAHYTVHLVGNPEVFVYKTNALHFIGKNAVGGGGNASFNATSNSDYYVRVFAFTNASFRLKLTTP
jgi:hypothetical protein